MDFKFQIVLDSLGKAILRELEANARISFSDLGRKVGLSSPAVTERVRKMEEAGIIKGYHAVIDLPPRKESITAFIRLTTLPERYARVKTFLENRPEILECHHVSGEESFMIKVLVPSVQDLEKIVENLSPFGQTRTSIVLSSPLVRSGP
ncbi:Lrp/AsnC family transcriptional regulator [Desulfospira joergensenii]|uniref:Lrp/AsnC family transcriptional regulator n=1 Tax=Desulfospira joergensenii TaxID=53329 RepID=UPI0003B43982|nr:Lrp/AsnC family transcriptional regulator [Desulfospira joergensenii]